MILPTVERYYRFHAGIYDATRWSFLFGRTELIQRVASRFAPSHILEVGCGTGKNLVRLCQQLSQARVVGLDISEDMLRRARKSLNAYRNRAEFLQRPYDQPLKVNPAFDLILFSYSLSMMPKDWENAIDSVRQDVKPGGLIAVVDFHDSCSSGFKRWMGVNHVRMDGHLLPRLQSSFRPIQLEINPAYAGWWSYFLFIGQTEG